MKPALTAALLALFAAPTFGARVSASQTQVPASRDAEDAAVLCIVTSRYSNVSNARCLAPDEANMVIDEVFAKVPAYSRFPGRTEATKRLIDDGMATLVSFNADDCSRSSIVPERKTFYELALKWMEVGYTEEYNGKGRIWHKDGATRCDGTSIEVDWKGKVKSSFCGGICDFQFEELFGKTASLELACGNPKNEEEVVVVADVETVDLASLGNLDHVTPAQPLEGEEGLVGEHSARATYVVEMRVKAMKRGECKFRRFSFRAVLDETNASVTGDWLFYRGMTLEVGFSRHGGKLKISRVEPVSPYPPYSKDGICIFNDEVSIASNEHGPDDVLPLDVRRRRWGYCKPRSAGRIAVLYGGGELAVFESKTNLVEGVYGVFPDYGQHVKITVYGREENNLDYWRYAWFAYSSAGTRPYGTCVDMSPEGDAKNADPAWRSSVSIRTLGEDEWIVEAVREAADSPGEAPDLEALTKELEAKGFANVAGAKYAHVCASPASYRLFSECLHANECEFDQRQSGNGWVVPANDGEAKFLAYGCVWWKALAEDPGTNKVRHVKYKKARLRRDMAFIQEYVDEVSELDAYLGDDAAADILAFALHARQAGFVNEGERIVASLFARKRNGEKALETLRKRLTEVVRDYPDFGAWENKMLEAEQKRLEKQRKQQLQEDGDESDK